MKTGLILLFNKWISVIRKTISDCDKMYIIHVKFRLQRLQIMKRVQNRILQILPHNYGLNADRLG